MAATGPVISGGAGTEPGVQADSSVTPLVLGVGHMVELLVLVVAIGRRWSTLVVLGRPGHVLTPWRRPDLARDDLVLDELSRRSWSSWSLRCQRPVNCRESYTGSDPVPATRTPNGR